MGPSLHKFSTEGVQVDAAEGKAVRTTQGHDWPGRWQFPVPEFSRECWMTRGSGRVGEEGSAPLYPAGRWRENNTVQVYGGDPEGKGHGSQNWLSCMERDKVRAEQEPRAVLQRATMKPLTAGNEQGNFHHLSQRVKLSGPEQTLGPCAEGRTSFLQGRTHAGHR